MNTEPQQLDELLGALRAVNRLGMGFGRAVNVGAERFAGRVTSTVGPTLGRMAATPPGRLASRIIQPSPTHQLQQAKSLYGAMNPQQQEIIRRRAADILKQRQMKNPTAARENLLARTAARTDRFKAQQKQVAMNRYNAMNPSQQADVRAKMVSRLQQRDPVKYADVIKKYGSDPATKIASRMQSIYRTGGPRVATTKAATTTPTTTPITAEPDAFSALSSLARGRPGVGQRQRVAQLYPAAKPVFASYKPIGRTLSESNWMSMSPKWKGRITPLAPNPPRTPSGRTGSPAAHVKLARAIQNASEKMNELRAAAKYTTGTTTTGTNLDTRG